MDRRVTPRLAAVSLSLGLALTALPVIAGNDSWTVAGQPPGGNVISVAVDPVTPTTLYAVSGPGIFESIDSGTHWSLSLPLPSNNASDLAVEPEDHATVYVATQGDGVFISRNSGATWTAINTGIGVLNGSQEDSVYRISVDPVHDGTAYALTLNTGVYKTTDHGAHWSAINTGITALVGNFNVLLNCLRVDPVTPNVLYLGVGEMSSGGTTTTLGGLYTSVDGGAHWSVTSIAGQGVGDFAFDPSDHTHLLVLSLGVESVTNSGATVTTLNRIGGSVIRFDPTNALHVYMGSSLGISESTDGGTTWTTISGTQNLDVDYLAIDPVTPGNMYASSTSWGVFTSADAGATWSPSSIGIYNVVPNVMFEGPDEVTYLATAGSGIYKSPDQGITWAEVGGGVTGSLPTAGDFVYDLIESPTAPATLYAGTTGGVYMTTDGGNTWTETDTGIPDNGYTLAIAMDPEAPATLYAATNTDGAGVYKSLDGGTTWTAAGNGLIINTTEGGLQALAVDPHDSNVVYAGSFFTGLFKSTDGGATWQRDHFTSTDVWAVAVDPKDSKIVYVATSKGFFKSTDGGNTWSESDSGLNGNFVMTVIQIDPANTSIIVVTQRYGIGPAYISSDAGATWSELTVSQSSGAEAERAARTAYMVPPGGHRVTRSGSKSITIRAVTIDPTHATQFLGAGSDGQIYAYNGANPPNTTSGSGGGTSGSGKSGGGSKGAISGSGGGSLSLLTLLGLAGFAARRRRGRAL